MPFLRLGPRKKRYVASLDADGCIFNDSYFLTMSVLGANGKLLAHLRSQMGNYDEHELLVGSNRQSYSADCHNCKKTITLGGTKQTVYTQQIVHALPQIHADLQKDFPRLKLNSYLLSDTFGNLIHGACFTKAASKDADNLEHSDWIFDKSKITLLYAQMHKIASENPNEEIYFEFIDDHPDILSGLEDFFQKNPDLIPPNLTLCLRQYSGEFEGKYTELKGSPENIIDYDYEENIHRMWGVSRNRIYPTMFQGMRDVRDHLKGLKIDAFKKNRITVKNKKINSLQKFFNSISGHLLDLKQYGAGEKAIVAELMRKLEAFLVEPHQYYAALKKLIFEKPNLIPQDKKDTFLYLIDRTHLQATLNADNKFHKAINEVLAILPDEDKPEFSLEKSKELLELLHKCADLTTENIHNLVQWINTNVSSLPTYNHALAKLYEVCTWQKYENAKEQLSSSLKGHSSIESAAQQVLAVAKIAVNAPGLRISNLNTITTVLNHTYNCVAEPSVGTAFTNFGNFTNGDEFKDLPKQRTWGKILCGAALGLLGAVIITTAVMLAFETAGISTPLSLLGIKLGLSVAAAGAVAAGFGLAGGATLGGGLYMWRKTNQLASPAQKVIRCAPKAEDAPKCCGVFC